MPLLPPASPDPQGEARVWPDPCRAQPVPTLSPPGKPGTGEFLLPRDG